MKSELNDQFRYLYLEVNLDTCIMANLDICFMANLDICITGPQWETLHNCRSLFDKASYLLNQSDQPLCFEGACILGIVLEMLVAYCT